jgi:uncharacterized protein YjbI with pentapeptide repeats
MVRRAAQRVVTAHLSPTHGDLYWADLDLDLDEAELHDLDLTGAAVRRISARRSVLHGDTKLAGLRVRETESLSGADFLGALPCDEMMVKRRTDLSGITVRGATSAVGCALRGHTILSGAQRPEDYDRGIRRPVDLVVDLG